MSANGLHDEIRELNLAYLMLTQHMLRDDRAAAIYRLGIGEEVADMLEGLSSAQDSGWRVPTCSCVSSASTTPCWWIFCLLMAASVVLHISMRQSLRQVVLWRALPDSGVIERKASRCATRACCRKLRTSRRRSS